MNSNVKLLFIILFSHGSLLCGSGQALNAHAARLRERRLTPIVEIGYLNYCDPPFAETVERCVGNGATRIVVTPYFLVPGYFVKVALPRCVEAARLAFPDIAFVVAEPIGFDDRLADALIASALCGEGSEHWRDDLEVAAQYCRPDSRCPLFGTPQCPNQPGPPDVSKEV